MTAILSELLNGLRHDPWRAEVGFSPEIEDANARLFDVALSEEAAAAVLNDWIHRHQPCLFGRIAAKCDFLSYCILREEDLAKGDEFIRDKIQEARTAWTREAFKGKKNGFIIALISQRIANAVPDETVKRLALRLATLYLLEEIRSDEVFLDAIWLEKPGPTNATWEWSAGVNYFSAQGDKRWWQDHRIPGGMAFSINSVGHMVKSGILGKAMTALDEAMGVSAEDWSTEKVDSLEKALELAMKTIANASRAVSGPATSLIQLPALTAISHRIPTPIELPPTLAGKDSCSYVGRYHTDYTIPSEYFNPAVKRPEHLPSYLLDFTYLFNSAFDNTDHERMGKGRRIRDDAAQRRKLPTAWRLKRAIECEVDIQTRPRLQAALGNDSH